MINATDSNSSKRRRITPHSLHIIDIPDAALAVVAEFLPKPSQALFAVAMTAPSSSWRESKSIWPPSATSEAIVSLCQEVQDDGNHRDELWEAPMIALPSACRESTWRLQPSAASNAILSSPSSSEEWGALDFVDIGKDLASKLTDDDLGAVLLCINAANKLKSLKLTGCVNITGHGLKPLYGSTVLEQIDLSLVGQHESPNIIWSGPWMSEAAVVPILDSIIDTAGNSLKQLQLPKHFRKNPSPLLEDFLERYDELLENCGGTCLKCTASDWGNMDGTGRPWIVEDQESQFCGLQNYTCYECTTHCCMDTCVERCMECEKVYCVDCVPVTECANCPNRVCKGCMDLKKCETTCEDYLCGSCVYVHANTFVVGVNSSCCMKGNDNEKGVGRGVRACSL